MTAGSCFAAAADSIITNLAAVLPSWNVRYAEPVLGEDVMNSVGEYRAVWVGVEGSSDFALLSAGIGAQGVGIEETTQVTVVFQLIQNPDETLGQLLVDEDVASAVGELVDWVTSNPKPASALPTGWDTVELTLGSISRTGGLTEDRRGLGRRVEVTVDVTARRC